MAQQGRNSPCTCLAWNCYTEKGTWHINIKCAFDKMFSSSPELTALTQELILNPLLSVKNICLVSEQQDGPWMVLHPNNSEFSNHQDFLHQDSHGTQLKLWKEETYWVHPFSTSENFPVYDLLPAWFSCIITPNTFFYLTLLKASVRIRAVQEAKMNI